MSRLIISARYWNDTQWLAASLRQIDYWEADAVYLSEGNWDPAWPARSTDSTREQLEAYAASRSNVYVIDNVRDHQNYRINQANTSNLVMRQAKAKPGDWMMIVDVDHFYLPEDIMRIKKLIKSEGEHFDYLTHDTMNFLYTPFQYHLQHDEKGSKLPSKILPKATWKKTNHITIRGRLYAQSRRATIRPTQITAYHYEGLRTTQRLHDKYSIGDRRHFDADSSKTKNLKPYQGQHPLFALETLNRLGFTVNSNHNASHQ